MPLVEASSGDCHRLFSPSTTTTVKGREREILFYDRNSVVWVTTMLQQQEQKKQSGSEYSRINYHPARAMMPIPPDIVASNNNSNNNRTRPAIGVKPIPPPKPFPRPPPSVRPPAALPPRPSSSVSSSCYVTSAGNSLQQRRRPLTCVNDMAQNPLYMCRLSSLSSPVLSKLVFLFFG